MSDELLKTLALFYSLVEKSRVFWILSGSVSLCLQGVDIIPSNDIDILTDEKGSRKIDQLLHQYRTKKPEFSETDKYRSIFGIYQIGKMQIEVMANFQYKLLNGNWSKQNQLHKTLTLDYKGMEIPVLSLNQELAEYTNTGKMGKVELIKARLAEEMS